MDPETAENESQELLEGYQQKEVTLLKYDNLW
jgi:hypothetical protein